jgi:diguanylate cyclase (GGDEF)-like protein/PAS domain S-box-containing protein
MKWQQRTPEVSGVAIAVSGMLLGMAIGARFTASSCGLRDRLNAFGVSALGGAGIGLLGLIVVGLIFLKSRADRRFRMAQDLLEAFLEHIPINVFFKDRSSRFVRVGRAMAEYFGLADPAGALNKTDLDFFSAEHANKALADEQEIIATGLPMKAIEERETWPDGRATWVLTTKVPLKDHRGQIIGTMGISQDITGRKEAEARIHHMALHDALTGLPNRALLKDRLAQSIALACRTHDQVAVLMLDLDRFKNVNDSLGHFAGDRLLESVSKRLGCCLRESDIVARLGGDEFVVGLPVVANDEEVESVAQKIMTSLAEPFDIEGHEVRIGVSIGIALHPADGEDPDMLLQAADVAMYEAKKRGRGIYTFFKPAIPTRFTPPFEVEESSQSSMS